MIDEIVRNQKSPVPAVLSRHTAGMAVPIWTLAGLAQVQEPEFRL
jgi:hypothetical protein